MSGKQGRIWITTASSSKKYKKAKLSDSFSLRLRLHYKAARVGGVKSARDMKLPKERLMAESHYQAHVSKLVERKRAAIEDQLNMTLIENVYIYAALLFVVTVSVVLFKYLSFHAGVIAGGIILIAAIIGFFRLPSHSPEYGKWEVSCNGGRFVRGDTINFRCVRIIDGEIVEETTRG